ncbi:endo alpha-1,4 polygalactosaminidase [Paenibacillus methanolicus]|nr:endo alpha-1,4 polygalactosaminidase [Paenibacillus methanolicus]
MLAQTDLAVIEPRQWQAEDIKALREAGTAVYGYLSVMETPKWNETRWAAVNDDMRLLVRGQPVRFEQWDAELMDLRSAAYRELLLAEIGELAARVPLDGIMLDTVGDIEEYVPEAQRPAMGEAYKTWLEEAARRNPKLRWLQNRGFAQLEACAPLLSGMLWEGWNGHEAGGEWVRQRTELLRRLRKGGLGLLASSTDPSPIHGETARAHGFVHWVSMSDMYGV